MFEIHQKKFRDLIGIQQIASVIDDIYIPLSFCPFRRITTTS
jgi:hypothetical protein